MCEYAVFRLWEFVGSPFTTGGDPRSAEPMNDAAGAAGLLNARGAEGWKLVPVVPQVNASAEDDTSNVVYMKHPAI
jgi:hypothetical protein